MAQQSKRSHVRNERAADSARTTALVVGLGLSFGFIGVVVGVASETLVSRPAGVAEGDYVTVGRRGAESTYFETVSTTDYQTVGGGAPELNWAYASSSLGRAEVADHTGASHTIASRRVSGNFLDTLGVRVVLGRRVLSTDAPGAIVSAELFRRVFAADPEVLGRFVTIDGQGVPIIGVAASGFAGVFRRHADCWILTPPESPMRDGVMTAGLYLFGALPGDLTIAGLRSLLSGHRFVLPGEGADRLEVVAGLEVYPDARRDTIERLAWLAMIVVLLLTVALMALVDYLAADQANREGSQAIRLAIGATPADVFRDNVSRHGLYAAAIFLVCLLSFLYMSDVLLGMEPFAQAVGTLRFSAVAAGLGASMVMLAVAFLWSCWIVARAVSRTTLGTANASSAAYLRSRFAWQALLFVTAASLLVTLSIGLRYLRDPVPTLGFDNLDALMVGVIFYTGGPSPDRYQRVRTALATNALVRDAARAEMLPLIPESATPDNRVKAKGFEGLDDVAFYRNRVDAAFFDVLDAQLLAGSLADDIGGNDVILSRSAVLRLGRDIEDVLGLAIDLAPARAPTYSDVFTVVAVVEDIPYGRLEDAPRLVLYTILPEGSVIRRWQDFWLIRHSANADDIVAPLHQLGGNVTEAYKIGTPASLLREAFERRSVEAVLAITGALAFVIGLAAIGNALARSVQDQATQIRIRFALGGTVSDEALRLGSRALVDLAVAGSVLAGVVFAARMAAPIPLAIVALPLLLAALAAMAVVCLAGSYVSVRRLATAGR